jgi:hypothetical protein
MRQQPLLLLLLLRLPFWPLVLLLLSQMLPLLSA